MVRERGYRGGPGHFRHFVTRIRPPPAAEALAHVAWRAHVDSGHLGELEIGAATRPLWAVLMVLSRSRRILPGRNSSAASELYARPRRHNDINYKTAFRAACMCPVPGALASLLASPGPARSFDAWRGGHTLVLGERMKRSAYVDRSSRAPSDGRALHKSSRRS
jgi:hypothetical protein